MKQRIMDKKVLVYKRKKADDLSERQKRRRRHMQIKIAKMNIRLTVISVMIIHCKIL